MGRRGRSRRQARRSRRQDRRQSRRGGQRQAPAPTLAAAAPTPEPTAAPSALVDSMTSSGPANPAAEAPQSIPVQAARGLIGDTALNAAASAGDTAVEAGQGLQQSGQERQSDFGERTGVPGSTEGQLQYKGQPQKQFGTGEGETLNPLDAPGRVLGNQVIGGMNKAQQLYGQAQEGVGNLVEGAGNLYNKGIEGADKAYKSLAETVEGVKDSAVGAGAEAGRQAGKFIKDPVGLAGEGSAAGKAVGDYMVEDQVRANSQPGTKAEMQAMLDRKNAFDRKKQLPTPVKRYKATSRGRRLM